MDSDNQEIIYCAGDNEYRIYCDNCDNLAIDRYCNNHLKSQTHLNKFHESQRVNNSSTQHSLCCKFNKCMRDDINIIVKYKLLSIPGSVNYNLSSV